MSQHFFPQGAEVLSAGASGDAHSIRHAPKAVSLTPIMIGTVIFLIGAFWVLAAMNNPIIEPRKAPGEGVTDFGRPIAVDFPSELTGTVDVFVAPRSQVLDFAVVDAKGQKVDEVSRPDLRTLAGEFEMVAAVDVSPSAEYEVSVPAGWSGRVVFILDDNPPGHPDSRSIVEGAVAAVAGAALASIWSIRRLRWRANLTRYKADLSAAGYVVD